jgi:hypothetical protein
LITPTLPNYFINACCFAAKRAIICGFFRPSTLFGNIMVVIRLARGGAKKRPSTTSLQPTRAIVAMAVSSSASVSTTRWLPVVKCLCASPLTVWLTGKALAHNCRHRCSSGSPEQSSLILVAGLTVKNASGVQVPDDLAQVGFVYGAYGVAGWVRIRPFSEDADALLKVKTWWLDKPGAHDVDVKHSKLHGGDVVAQMTGITDRNVAEALKGAAVSFPVAVSGLVGR